MGLKKEIRSNRARKTLDESRLHGLSHHILRQRLEDIKLKIWLSDINNVVRKKPPPPKKRKKLRTYSKFKNYLNLCDL